MTEIATARTTLRPVQSGDLDVLHALFTDADVRRYIWDDVIIGRDVTAGIVERSQAQFRDEGHGLWLVRPHAAEDIAGFCGFWYFREPPQLEILYGLLPAHWGRGLATEIAQALIHHAFAHLGFDRVIGSTDAANVASCGVMERAGMTLLRRERIEGRETIFYLAEKNLRARSRCD